MNWVVGILILVSIGFILDREVYFYEGAHLGPRLQSWLYDRWSKKYDAGKQESQLRDDEMLAGPLLEKLTGVPEPFILDFATGTGRLSHALLRRTDFQGRIVALDISKGMLEQAAEKLRGPVVDKLNSAESADPAPLTRPAGQPTRVEFLRHQSMPLPFPDAAFDAVCCLEVLELLPDAQVALNEMSRLLRPGGILLASRGTEQSGRKAKVKSKAELTAILEASGFENIRITKWWKLFDRVLGNKRGTSSPLGAKSLIEVLLCASCASSHWTTSRGRLTCTHCGNVLSVTDTGIVLN